MLGTALHNASAAANESKLQDLELTAAVLNTYMPQSNNDSGQAHPSKTLHSVYTAARWWQDPRPDGLCYTDAIRLNRASGQAHLMAVVVTCCRGWKNCSKVNGCLQH